MLFHWFQIPHFTNSTCVLAVEDGQRVPLMEIHQGGLLPVGGLHLVLCNENLQAEEATLESSNTQPASRLPTKKDISILEFEFNLFKSEIHSPGATLVGFHLFED